MGITGHETDTTTLESFPMAEPHSEGSVDGSEMPNDNLALHADSFASAPMSSMNAMVEIPLDQETFSTLCRRGRRRLRDIQTSCDALLQLDRNRRVLYATGTPAALKNVRTQVAGLGGPRKYVSSAVWAELMRTRILQDGTAVLSRIQQESGCRIHIERRQQEVRLFGPPEATSVADALLNDFSATVREDRIPMDGRSLAESTLQAVAHQCGVTLRVEEDFVAVLGLHAHVTDALQELSKILAGAPMKESEDSRKPDVPPMSMSLAQVARSDMDNDKTSSKSMPPGTRLQQVRSYGVPSARQGPTAPRSSAHRQQGGPRYQQHTFDDDKPKACPTCGCGNFCSSCGAPVVGWANYLQRQQAQQQVHMPYVDMSNQNMQFIPVMMQPADGSSQGQQMMFQMVMPQQGGGSMDDGYNGGGMMQGCYMQMPQQ